MRKVLIGVMGPGDAASPKAVEMAFTLGQLIAKEGWVLLSGGRNSGIMDAVNKGAKSKNGLTVGIIPAVDNSHTSGDVDIAIVTGMGSARNNINILTADALIVVAESIGSGTASEACLALKAKKPIILVAPDITTQTFFENLARHLTHTVLTPQEAIAKAKEIISSHDN